MQKIKIKLLPGGKMPERKTDGAAAFDVFCRLDKPVKIQASDGAVLIPLGFALELPPGYVAYILPRSSTGLKTPLRIPNSIGVIDSDYRGEVHGIFSFDNSKYQNEYDVFSVSLYRVHPATWEINNGDRLCQMIIDKLPDVELVQAEELSETDRGSGGFGSTGV